MVSFSLCSIGDANVVTDVLFLWTVLFRVTGLLLQVPDKRQHPPQCCTILPCTEVSGSVLKWTAFVSQYSLRDFYFSNNGMADETSIWRISGSLEFHLFLWKGMLSKCHVLHWHLPWRLGKHFCERWSSE